MYIINGDVVSVRVKGEVTVITEAASGMANMKS